MRNNTSVVLGTVKWRISGHFINNSVSKWVQIYLMNGVESSPMILHAAHDIVHVQES